MSGGGRLSIDHRIESPKHRVSLGLLMNYYVHRNNIHNMHNLNGTLVSHEEKTMYIETV